MTERVFRFTRWSSEREEITADDVEFATSGALVFRDGQDRIVLAVKPGDWNNLTEAPPQLAHVAAPVDHPLALPKRGGIGNTACGLSLTGDVLIATRFTGISCPLCAVVAAVDPSLLGPV